MAVGDHKHRVTESLNLNNWKWSILEPYPNVNDIHSMKIVSYGRSFFVFGGIINNNQVTDNIMSLTIKHGQNESWSWVGSLLSKRVHFSIFLIDNDFFIIGGKKKHKNEICTLSNIINCKQDFSIDYEPEFEQPVLFSYFHDKSVNKSCSKIPTVFNPVETNELIVLSNKTFHDISNFALIHNNRNNKNSIKKYCFNNFLVIFLVGS